MLDLPTGTLTAKLDNNSLLGSVMYYDYKGRVIQSISANHMGGLEKEYVLYNFSGQPEKRKHIHSASGKTTQTELYTYAYDHAGRLKTTTHKLNTGAAVTLINNTYDGLGRLSSNKRNGIAKLETNYAYNTRSWLISTSTGTLFSQRLYYNDSYGGNKPLYNGNISAMSWKTSGSSVEKGYKFTYDNLSRLSGAGYLENAVAKTNYTSSYAYDKHGNITKLTRNGNTGTSTHGVIDNLALTYSGNQLTKVEDTAGIPSISTSADFRNGSTATIEYTYDGNGNLTKDLNKGISSIEYNFLNLPGKLVVSNSLGSATNTYVYSADGRKLSVSKGTFKSDYAGHLIYENGVLKRILVDGGYIDMPGKTYHFYLQDHLGNNRVVANQSGTVVQGTQYYPFGMSFPDGTGQPVQPYKYNGKELDGDRGLNFYDYHARQMDPALGRFTSVDPLAEKYYSVSPYVYVGNNPMRYVDNNGKEIGIPPLGPGLNFQLLYAQPRANEVVNRVQKGENVSQAVWNTYKDDGIFVLRYATPVEDFYGVFSGIDFNGYSYNRAEAGTWAAMGLIPFGKFAGNAGKLIKTAFKYSDEVADLVKVTGKVSGEAKEIITVTKSGKFSDALEIAKDIVGDLGEGAKNYEGKFGYQKNKVTGKNSRDGTRGYRVDYDENKGAHINWWSGKNKGAVLIETNEEQIRRIINNEIMK